MEIIVKKFIITKKDIKSNENAIATFPLPTET